MPNRYLRESICTSRDIAALTWFEEACWSRLIVNCDDYGRFHGDPDIVRARCFPKQLAKVSAKQIEAALRTFEQRDMIRCYDVDGEPYVWLPAWEKHQGAPRAKASRFPDVPADVLTSPTYVRSVRADADTPRADVAVVRSSVFDVRSSSSSSDEPDVRIASPPSADDAQTDARVLFESLAEACGIDWHHLTPAARGELNAAVKALREAGDATPDEVRRRAQNYRLSYPTMAFTPSALAKHWPAMANGARGGQALSTADRILLRAVGGDGDGQAGSTSPRGAARSGLPPA